MGSFDYTCAISGLPIACGDAVRYLLLTQNPYHRGKTAAQMTCYTTDVWFPRTFPLRGRYNDYGAVDDLQEGAQQDAWLAGFKVDLVEKGWGDNSCHDVPTRKDMKLAPLLEGVREGRVHVRQDVGDSKRICPVPKGIPTRRRVERALAKFNLAVSEAYGTGMLVDRVDRNTVRVRVADYGARTETLTKVRDDLVSQWAGAVCGGSGSYAGNSELILRPLPGVRCRDAQKRRDPVLCVSHAMIREDVWHAICGLTLKCDYDGAETVDKFRAAAVEAWEKSLAAENDHRRFMMRHEAYGVCDDVVPFTVGLGTHWWAIVDAHIRGELSDAERDDFLRTAGEFVFVQRWLATTRYQWHPSSSCGPQFGEWGAHATLLDALHSIAKAESDRREAERAEYEADAYEAEAACTVHVGA